MISGERQKVRQKAVRWPCGVCSKGVGSNSLQCNSCQKWVHKKCRGIKGRQVATPAPHHHSAFYRLDALPAAQPTASKHWRHWPVVRGKNFTHTFGIPNPDLSIPCCNFCGATMKVNQVICQNNAQPSFKRSMSTIIGAWTIWLCQTLTVSPDAQGRTRP